MNFIFNIFFLYLFGFCSNLAREALYKIEYQISENEFIKFRFPLLVLLCSSLISLVLEKYKRSKIVSSKSETLVFFSTKDKIYLGIFHFMNKYLPEYALQFTDYLSKIIGKSCKSLATVLILVLHKTPLIGNFLNLLINQKESIKIDISINDIVKGVLTTITVMLFAVNSDKLKNNSVGNFTLNSTLIGFSLILFSLFFDSLKSLKCEILNKQINEINDTTTSELLKLEYVKVFNTGLFVISVLGLSYQVLYSNLLEFLYFNLLNIRFLVIFALASFTSSFSNYFHFAIMRYQGPLTLSVLSAFRKVLSILLSIIVFNKSIDIYKTSSIVLASCIIIYELYIKLSKGKGGELAIPEKPSSKV